MKFSNRVTQQLGIETPVFCGAMFPCSNPELVAAVSESGGMGIIQPLSLTYVWGWDFRKGLHHMRTITKKPLGMNILLEGGSKKYYMQMREWVDIALDEGIRFFVTALGNPKEYAEIVHREKAILYHDVTERKWAEKAVSASVDGLICVNNRAGGHAGRLQAERLYLDLRDFQLPLVCAGGIGDELDYIRVLKLGYEGVQLGTRFIATKECKSPEDYKKAIVDADEKDIVLTERVTGVPLAVINTPYVEKIGTTVGPFMRWMLKGSRTKKWARLYFAVLGLKRFKKSMLKGMSTKDYWQAGKSVAHIKKVDSVKDVMARFKKETQEYFNEDVTSTLV